MLLDLRNFNDASYGRKLERFDATLGETFMDAFQTTRQLELSSSVFDALSDKYETIIDQIYEDTGQRFTMPTMPNVPPAALAANVQNAESEFQRWAAENNISIAQKI